MNISDPALSACASQLRPTATTFIMTNADGSPRGRWHGTRGPKPKGGTTANGAASVKNSEKQRAENEAALAVRNSAPSAGALAATIRTAGPRAASGAALRSPGCAIGPRMPLHLVDDHLVAMADAALTARPTFHVRVVTWNIWFDRKQQDERLAALMTEVVREAADVICLQEVLPHVAEAIKSCKPLCELYDVSPNSISSYGVLMLVAVEHEAKFSNLSLPGSMGRSLVVAECADLVVATVHLESLNNVQIRREQLQIASKHLADTRRPAVLCGDFNFDSSQTWGDWRKRRPFEPPPPIAPNLLENAVLAAVLPDFVDTWAAVHPNDPGLTFDGGTNPHCRDAQERMRYDRVMAKGLRPMAAAMLGVRANALGGHAGRAGDGSVVPSDHYGVRVDLVLPSSVAHGAEAMLSPSAQPFSPVGLS